jgi:hypothetical protein
MLYSYIFKLETSVIFFLNTATFAINFICKNKWHIKNNFCRYSPGKAELQLLGYELFLNESEENKRGIALYIRNDLKEV